MTCVGNEIDAHLFGGDDIGRVEHANEDRLIRQGADRQTPRPPGLGNARHLEVRGTIGEHLLERLRVTDGETHILPLNPAEQTSGRVFASDTVPRSTRSAGSSSASINARTSAEFIRHRQISSGMIRHFSIREGNQKASCPNRPISS